MLTASSFSRLAALTLVLGAFLSGCINDGAPANEDADDISRQGDKAAARVGETAIYESDVLRAAKAQKLITEGESLGANDPRLNDVLSELVDQRLLKLAALDKGLEANPEIKRQLAESRERILATYFVTNHLEQTVTEANLKTMYEAQSGLRQNGTEANVRLIRVKTEAEIKNIVEKMGGGEDFGELAAAFSTDANSRGNDGALGYVSRAMLPKDIATAVFSTKAGALSKPFETKDSWYIVEVLSFRKPQQASFEAMRAQLRQFKTYSEIQSLMTNLRDKGEVEILIEGGSAEKENAND